MINTNHPNKILFQRDITELVSFIAARIGGKAVRRSLPRIRVSIRLVMILVAIAAVLCRLVPEQRRKRFLILAQSHESQIARDLLGDQRGLIGLSPSGKVVTAGESSWHEAMAERYRTAAKSPWIPLGPDPDLSTFKRFFSQEFGPKNKDSYKSLGPDFEKVVARRIEQMNKIKSQHSSNSQKK